MTQCSSPRPCIVCRFWDALAQGPFVEAGRRAGQGPRHYR